MNCPCGATKDRTAKVCRTCYARLTPELRRGLYSAAKFESACRFLEEVNRKTKEVNDAKIARLKGNQC